MCISLWLPRTVGLSAALLAALGLTAPVLAQQHPQQSPSPAERQASAHGGQEEHTEHEEHVHRNEVALILAGTYESEPDETYFTVGAEYERRFTRAFGWAVEGEYVTDAEAWVFAAPLVFRPAGGGFKLIAGPGFENKEPHEEHGEDGEHGVIAPHSEEGDDEDERETFFLMRLGAGYGAEFAERYSLAPFVNVDFVRERGEWVYSVVFGVTLGFAF